MSAVLTSTDLGLQRHYNVATVSVTGDCNGLLTGQDSSLATFQFLFPCKCRKEFLFYRYKVLNHNLYNKYRTAEKWKNSKSHTGVGRLKAATHTGELVGN